jgi:hypothetical protein
MNVLRRHLRRGRPEVCFSLRVKIVEAGNISLVIKRFKGRSLDEVGCLDTFRQDYPHLVLVGTIC